jgi:hypothetical protein
MHVSLQDPAVEDIGKSAQVSPPSTSPGNPNDGPNQIRHNNMSHSTSQSQTSDNDIISPSQILSMFQAASVSRTLTLRLYLAATDSNNSSQANATLLDNINHGHSDITALKMGLYTLPSKHGSEGHVYLYPNSTLNDR